MTPEDTYAAVPRTPGKPRLVEIEEMIRMNIEDLSRVVRHGIADDRRERFIHEAVTKMMNDLVDHHLIGLPSSADTSSRTSVRCDLVAEIGRRVGCRKGEDADDVLAAVMVRL